MVGVPRSTGCATCVKRRIKCDEAKPYCLKCQKSGRSCPGYTKRFVFKQSSLAASRASSQSSDESLSSEEVQVIVRGQHYCKPGSWEWPALVEIHKMVPGLSAPLAHQAQLMGNLITAFTPTQNKLPAGAFYTKSWLGHVHDRIGVSVPLDLSMRSLACLYNGLGHTDSRAVMTGRSLYVSALRTLRDDMATGKSSQSDIQSAVMLLTFYELMSNRTEEAWIKHSGGASQIMRLRGAAAYRSGFDYSMYLVCRSYIMIEAFITDTACFLEEPEWEALTRLSKSPDFLLREKIFTYHARAPRLLRDAQRANKGLHDPADVIERALELRATSKNIFKEWWTTLERTSDLPVEKRSGDFLFPNMYWFPNFLTQGLMCSHYATLSLLNQLLIDAGHADTRSLMEENRAAAVEICKCTAQAQTRLLGSIYMPFWLRVAADGCAPEHYPWIMEKWNYFRTADGVWTNQRLWA